MFFRCWQICGKEINLGSMETVWRKHVNMSNGAQKWINPLDTNN